MQYVQSLQQYSPIQHLREVWRDRASTVIAVAVGVLLGAALFALIWSVVHSPDPPTRRQPRIIRLLLPPPQPPPRPPQPPRETVHRPQPPPPIPVPPKKPVVQQ